MAQIWWFVRDASRPAAKANYDQLVNVGKGAAHDDRHDLGLQVVGSAWPRSATR